MKNGSKFLERICQRVRRRTRRGGVELQKNHPMSSTSSRSKPCGPSRRRDTSGVSSSSDCRGASLDVARGAFLDSTLQRTRPAVVVSAAAEDQDSLHVSSTHSLPARMDSLALRDPPAPALLRVQQRQEQQRGAWKQGEPHHAPVVSTAAQESLSVSSGAGLELSTAGEDDGGLVMTGSKPAEAGKELCLLSATDSGLYSEDSGEEYLEVFSDNEEDEEEEDDGLVDDGWRIPAEEVSLDKVMAYNRTETVYR